MTTELDRLLELTSKHGIHNLSTTCDVCLEIISLKSQIESKLAQAEQRLTPLGIKWVQCIKCRKDYVEFYPKQQCTCGSYESEEVDALLTDLLNDSRELSQLREEIKNHECLELQCPLCDGDLIVDDCVEHCVYCNSSLKHKFVLEDKSLRPIVQALRDRPQLLRNTRNSGGNLAKIDFAIEQIESILASSEVKQ